MEEIWKDIPEMDGYQASNLGQIRSIDRIVNRIRNGKIQQLHRKGVTLKPTKEGRGYYQVLICLDSIKKHKKVHRLVASTFIANPNNHPEVNHKNGKKEQCHVNNLEWCTHTHNIQHAFATGLNKGSQVGKSGKLHSRSQPVLSIKDTAIIEHESRNLCGQYLGVSNGAVGHAIKNGFYCKGHKIYAL